MKNDQHISTFLNCLLDHTEQEMYKYMKIDGCIAMFFQDLVDRTKKIFLSHFVAKK